MSVKEFNTILVSKENYVTTITLNRPKKYNAISPELITDMIDAIKIVGEDSETRAVLITGAGKAFCAGGDVQEDIIPVSKMRPSEWRAYIKSFCDMIRNLNAIPKPVIAGINGVTVGGGCDIAMSCDIRIASDAARFGYGYIKMGIISDMGGNYLLPRLVGSGAAKLFAFTGDMIDAKEAFRIGLIDRLVADSEFNEKTNELVTKIASGPTAAIVLIKEAMRKSSTMDLDTSLEYTMNLQNAILDSQDLVEGYTAFLEKRKPVFKGK
jgi:enoyl-CoA hydratase/carnithine racemase